MASDSASVLRVSKRFRSEGSSSNRLSNRSSNRGVADWLSPRDGLLPVGLRIVLALCELFGCEMVAESRVPEELRFVAQLCRGANAVLSRSLPARTTRLVLLFLRPHKLQSLADGI